MLIKMILCFFPYSIETGKCSSNCNNINNPLAKFCVPDFVKKNVKVFNLVSGTNETRHIEWYEMYNCKCTFSSSVCNNNVGMIINAVVKAKN